MKKSAAGKQDQHDAHIGRYVKPALVVAGDALRQGIAGSVRRLDMNELPQARLWIAAEVYPKPRCAVMSLIPAIFRAL